MPTHRHDDILDITIYKPGDIIPISYTFSQANQIGILIYLYLDLSVPYTLSVHVPQ